MLFVLLGCGTGQNSSGDNTLRFLTTNLQPAFIGEPYAQDILLTQGTRPFNVKVKKGPLPPGLTLSGRTIAGTPTGDAKVYNLQLEASDANLSIVNQEFALELRVNPPSKLAWKLPQTAIKDETRIPFELENPKKVRSFKVAIPLPKGVSFVRFDTAQGQPILLSKIENDVLRVDGALTQAINSAKTATVFYAVLKSDTAVKLEGTVGFELRAGQKTLAFTELSLPKPPTPPAPPAGPPPAAPQPQTPPASPTPPAAPTPPASPTPPAANPTPPASPSPATPPPATPPASPTPPAANPEPPGTPTAPPAPGDPGPTPPTEPPPAPPAAPGPGEPGGSK